MTVPSSAPAPPRGLGASPLPRVPMYDMRLTVQYTVYCNYTLLRMIITDEDNNENANEQIGEMITRGSFAGQNGHYKLTCKCESTIFICYHAIAEK